MRLNVLLQKSPGFKSVSVETFEPAVLVVSNPTASPINFRQGGLDNPTDANADRQIPGTSLVAMPVVGRDFGFAFSTPSILGTSQSPQTQAGLAFLTKDEPPPVIGSIQPVARPEFIDRNPTNLAKRYVASAVAPHANTQRLSYTCPTGRKARIRSAQSFLRRDAGCTVAGEAFAIYSYVPLGSGANDIEFCYSAHYGRITGIGDRTELTDVTDMLPGDAVSGITSDPSNGGSYQYLLGLTLFEYDA